MAISPAVQGNSSTPPPPTTTTIQSPLDSSALPSTPPRRRASISNKRLSATVIQGQAATDFKKEFGNASTTTDAAPYSADSQQQGPPLPRVVTSPTSSSTRPTIPSPHKVDHTSSDAQGGAPATATNTTLRSRKLSVSTRNLPTSTTSSHQLTSPQSTTSPRAQQPLMAPTPRTPNRATSPAAAAASEVGLGLMLDEDGSHSRQGSLDSNGSSAFNSRGPVVAGAGIDRWGLEAEGDSASSSSSSSLGGGGGGADAFASPSKRSSFGTVGSTATRRGEALPRLSTVTTANGATSSPLLIFTGSPNPSPSLSTSPRSFSPSPNRSPSPSHTAYNLPSSRSSTPSRPQSHITSQPMDRTSSSSKSREIHGRQKSLTSACPPVTSSYSGTPEVHQGVFGAVNGVAGAYPPASPQRGWRVYDWGLGGGSSTREKGGRSDSDDEDPRKGAKGGSLHHYPPSTLSALLSLPSSLLAFFLSPLSASSLHHHSPQLNASTAPTSKSPSSAKRYPLLLRLLLLSYLVFSSLFFGLHASSWASGNDPKGASKYLRTRLGPRGADGALLPEGVEDVGSGFMLGKVGGVGQWAQKMAEGVRWNRGGGAGELDEDEGGLDARAQGLDEVEEWGLVRRLGVKSGDQRLADQNPLSPLSHTYRFAKMHDKIHWDLHDEIVPFTFHASSIPAPNDITACLYSNEAWLSALPAFLHAWDGPISLVFESAHSRTSPQRNALIESIAALRESDDLVRKYVDFHIVGTPASMSERTLNKTRERMIERPMAQNYHLNLARFFAPTDVIFLVGDARVLPSPGLKRRLQSETITDLILERGDAVVVPTFGFIRDPTGDTNTPKTPSLHDLRTKLDLPLPSSPWDGVSAAEFPSLASEHILSLYETLPLPPAQWPTKKQSLVTMINTRIPTPETPTTARLALFDRRWDLNHGPTNWYLWRKSSADPHLHDTPEAGGGTGLGVDGRIGGGRELYRVMDYDLHYAPNVVVSKKGQPWCTERFEQMQSACVYQMYLSGAEMWVLPDEWTYTLEVVEKKPEGWKEDPAEKLKNSISSRLYGKFHQEACMHYGREFLSIQMWDSEKAQHLRETCARTLSTWGMGLVAPKAVSA